MSALSSLCCAPMAMPLLIPEECPHQEGWWCPQNIPLSFSPLVAAGLSKKLSVSHKDQMPGTGQESSLLFSPWIVS